MKILTCNIRCFGANDGKDNWMHRKELCARVIAAQSPDIICFQEMWAEQFADLSAAFPDFEWYALADEPIGRRPMNAIFYRRETYARISAGGYWLSESPHVVGTKSWESACVRQANWIRLEHRTTGFHFRVVNTHLDHIGQVARENQARMIVEDAQAYPSDFPQILTGDMNCDTNNPAIAAFKAGGWQDSYGALHGTENPGHSYHAFLGPKYVSKIGKMDWIFWRGKLKPVDARILMDAEGERFPSDHYFVSATFATDLPEHHSHTQISSVH